MPQLLRRPVRSLLGILFLFGFTLALWVGQGLLWLGASHAATPAQFVQEGVFLYQTGDYQGAVDR